MKFTISAFLASLPYLNLVKAAPAPSYTEAAATYTVSKCVTYYGSTNAATMRTTTSYNSVTFYDSTTSTKYPYTFTRTPAVSTTFKTNSTTVYSTSTVYKTVPTATTTSTSVYTITLSPYVTTSVSTAWLTTTSWVPTTSTVAAASNFVPLASHVVALKATPNTLPAIFATPASTAVFLPYMESSTDSGDDDNIEESRNLDLAAAFPTAVRCALLVVVDSTSTLVSTATGTYTTTAATPVRTSTTTSTVSGTRTSTIQRGSTTVTQTTTSTYSRRTTSTILTSTTSTSTTTSRYAAATYHAACGPNNLLWGINKIEIPWPTNGGNWKVLYGFKSAYDCCVYGIKNNYGGSVFHTYSGECQLAGPPAGTCSALAKTFKFYTGCPTSGSWVVSNGNCGQGTWTGKQSAAYAIDGGTAVDQDSLDEGLQELLGMSDVLVEEQHQDLKA